MSWFPESMKGEGPSEIEDGVLLERRDVLKISFGALALLSLGGPQRALAQEAATSDDAELAWDQLVKEAVPMAEKLVTAKKPNEEAYLARFAALVHRLKIPEDDFEFRAKRPLSVVQFKLKPGKGFPWHDHRDYNGLILCVAGDARIKSAEVVGDDPRASEKSFLIRQTMDARLSPGRVSCLSRRRDNIHDVRGAGENGARLLDFFTFFDSGGRSVYLKVEAEPKDLEKGLFEASWR
jgi:predicted metal-dependent enzyme (double-stranded beta helix superfamily)